MLPAWPAALCALPMLSGYLGVGAFRVTDPPGLFLRNSKAKQHFPPRKKKGFDRLQASHRFFQSVSMDHRLKQSGHIRAEQQMHFRGADRADGQSLVPQYRKVAICQGSSAVPVPPAKGLSSARARQQTLSNRQAARRIERSFFMRNPP